MLIVLLLIIYRLFPQLLSKLILSFSTLIILRIIANDKKEPISGLFRYFSYLAAISSLIQFAISWVWSNCI
ncbi:MAG: hypothetical protein A2033_02460 [Bacteroidetes bacterium GWA2_31_9]|nr:MAG: hypothetical protein A2033_02460 [Bacteroidetes bacterium GWA2_31_9]